MSTQHKVSIKETVRVAETPATAKAPETLGRDCIFLKDWVIDCNIGVYAEEKGVTQKVRLTVDAYLSADVRAGNDDMDTVPSYTDIIDAVNDITAAGHINLIETFAESIAERCLKDRRLSAMRIRIEKLERGPVRGVEIFRTRVEKT
ncbi:dihydroneopterin aldolase [Hyphomicrobium sp. LHD-15]|uniref:dihydroneopterin aldolase n=1 Tax=Hyphomicrobium sp. LHD-15 TaxID=3072142 RepID=UPI00280DAEFD|nr:dihydroneopterin aldolase [Hyphomicrobium sp. LHD-15]MDQ8697404.1 dihydroneopterin aldolase [Hyphomicrobium sp. LHD-15]